LSARSAGSCKPAGWSSSPAWSGKTHLLTRIEEELARSSRIAVAKSLAVDKRRTSLPWLIEAMFYDLTPGDRSTVKIPLRIVGEVDVPHAELTGYEGNHGLRRLLGRSHAEARIP
jgi:hypothetical protein